MGRAKERSRDKEKQKILVYQNKNNNNKTKNKKKEEKSGGRDGLGIKGGWGGEGVKSNSNPDSSVPSVAERAHIHIHGPPCSSAASYWSKQ